jgi:cell wall-active antibiotic response 4TMS protein YvqF
MTSPNTPLPAIHPTIAPELVPERRGAIAVLSSATREGEWVLPRQFRALSFMGSVELDLTTALLGPGTSEIEVWCMCGSIDVIAPPNLRVELEVDPILGAADIVRKAPSTTAPEAPLVRIRGTVFMGAASVRIIDPNAPGFLKRLKKKLAKRAGG